MVNLKIESTYDENITLGGKTCTNQKLKARRKELKLTQKEVRRTAALVQAYSKTRNREVKRPSKEEGCSTRIF